MTEQELLFALVRKMGFLFTVERKFTDPAAPVYFTHAHNLVIERDERRLWVEFHPTAGLARVDTFERRGEAMAEADELADDFAAKWQRYGRVDLVGEKNLSYLAGLDDEDLRVVLAPFHEPPAPFG